MLEPQDAARVSELVEQRVQQAMANPDSAERIFVERLTSGIVNNRFGADGPKIGAYLDQAEFVKNNPALKDIVYRAITNATEEE
jgi:hypothetical protein